MQDSMKISAYYPKAGHPRVIQTPAAVRQVSANPQIAETVLSGEIEYLPAVLDCFLGFRVNKAQHTKYSIQLMAALIWPTQHDNA